MRNGADHIAEFGDLGTAPGLGAPVPSVEDRLGGLAGTIAIAVCTSTLTRAWIAPARRCVYTASGEPSCSQTLAYFSAERGPRKKG